jgi:hypothetical protein
VYLHCQLDALASARQPFLISSKRWPIQSHTISVKGSKYGLILSVERTAGLEPASSALKGEAQPLDQVRFHQRPLLFPLLAPARVLKATKVLNAKMVHTVLS